jgi:hypothetical protein
LKLGFVLDDNKKREKQITCSVPVFKVSTLYHEVLDDSMENGSLEMEIFAASGRKQNFPCNYLKK